jgi:hypothetical protein
MVSRIAGMPYPTIIIAFYVLLIWKHINVPSFSPGRVVDILGASGASDPGSNPGRGVLTFGYTLLPILA